MAIALRSSAEAKNTATDTHTVTTPAGAASGDVLVGCWYCADGDDWTGPGGWTDVLTVNDGAYGSFLIARLVLSGAPAGSYAANTGASVTSWGTITAWTGANTTTPEDVAAASTAQDTNYEAPSLTTVTNGAALICFYGETGDETGTRDAAQTLIGDGVGTPSYLTSYEARPTAGSTGVRTLTGWSERSQCASYALRPAAAATAVPNASMLMGIGI